MTLEKTIDINHFQKSFDETNQMIKEHLEHFENTFKETKPILEEYHEKNIRFELGFNVFLIVAEKYRHENLHSDILRTLLDLDNQKFLKSFIEFLNSIRKTKAGEKSNSEEFEKFQEKDCSKIKWDDFSHGSIIEREVGHIDLSIKNEKSKSVIIVESKVNYADDRSKQLPGYYQYYKDKGYEKEKIYIVYLLIDINKKIPNEYDWTADDREKVYNNFITLHFYTKKENDLYSLVKSCIADIENVNILATFKQYADLIKFLTGNIMDRSITEKFYEKVKSLNLNYNELNSYRKILNDFPVLRTDSIEKHYQDSEKRKPFPNIWRYSPKGDVNRCISLDNYSVQIEDETYDLFIEIWSNNWHETHCSYSVSIAFRNIDKEQTKEKLKFLQDKNIMDWDANWERYGKNIPYFKNSIEQREKELFDFMDEKLLPAIRENLPLL